MTYNGLLDPLGPSQILPYLEALATRWRIAILSFERPDRLASRHALDAMTRRMQERGIAWTWLRYHKWPSLLATTYDLLAGAVALRRITKANRTSLVHCRGYLPMAIALRGAPRVPALFDIRGLQAEEYVDGGVWRKGELKWRLAKRSERQFFERAAGAVVLTQNIKPYVQTQLSDAGRTIPLEVIPCCVDLERFSFSEEERIRRRRELGLADEAPLFIYSGSVGTWYLIEEMARFVAAYRETSQRDAHLLWMVNNDPDRARRACADAGLPADRVHVVEAPSKDVPAWLAAGDCGLALIKPSFSKRSSSPTKYAEYLAVGLPVVISRGVGDGEELVEYDAGVALSSFDRQALRQAALELAPMLGKPRGFFREIARSKFDLHVAAVPTYQKLYEQLSSP